MIALPRLYPILDADTLEHAGIALADAAQAWRDAGVRWLQYRDKSAADDAVVERMRMLRAIFPRGEAILLLNDRVHLCSAVDADGVHIGQEDLAPGAARERLGAEKILGVSTHNAAQLRHAAATGAADYLAIGPVFATASKQNPDPVVGLVGVAAARTLTSLPLVAIGGIGEAQARSVMAAGADSVALISALLPQGSRSMVERVRDILDFFR